MKKLPILFLVDNTFSIKGDVENKVRSFIQDCIYIFHNDPHLCECGHLSIISYADSIPQIVFEYYRDKEIIGEFKLAQRKRLLGNGLKSAINIIESETKSFKKEYRGNSDTNPDWGVVLIILIFGESDDHYENYLLQMKEKIIVTKIYLVGLKKELLSKYKCLINEIYGNENLENHEFFRGELVRILILTEVTSKDISNMYLDGTIID